MNNATLVVDTLPNLEMLRQIGDLKGIVEAAANAFHQISMFSLKLVGNASLPGPEISGIIQLAQQHHMLSEAALQQVNAKQTGELTK